MTHPSTRYLIRCPDIICPMQASMQARISLDLSRNTPENWELFVLLQHARQIHDLLKTLQPELQTYNLVAENPKLKQLFTVLESIPTQVEHCLKLEHPDKKVVTDSLYGFNPTTKSTFFKGLFP